MSHIDNGDFLYFDETTKKKLPEPGKRNILITSALPYVNNVPHLGNIIGCVLSGDVFARYCRLRDYQCLHVCGTDEYGTATEMKALKEGKTPKEICDKFHELHKGIYEWFNIDFNFFGRTTTQHQTEICQDMFLKLHQRGYVTVKSLEQLHCPHCDKFLADRFVNGTCPHCGYDDARGDQCDKCAKLLDAIQLIQPKCYVCSKTPGVKKSEHLFLDLTQLSGATERYLNEVTSSESSHWSNNAISIAKSWIKSGLEERCITRDLKWGTPVPLKGYEDKVFYVWFDAPIGYLSITKSLIGDDWVKWWKNDDVELYQFVGKDNVAFHSIIFPSTQIGTGENYTKVRHLCATEYLNYEGQKFSKSRGTGVFGDAAASTGIPADVWRFYLIYMRPETQDTTFSWDDFVLKVNSELLNNLGNFVNRALSFMSSRFDGIVPPSCLDGEDYEFIKDINIILDEFIASMEHVKLRDGLQHILAMSRRGNQYLQITQPWKLLKSDDQNEKSHAGSVIAVAANVCVILSAMLYPFMPDTSRQIREQCGILKPFLLPAKFCALLKAGHHIGKPAPIFTALDPQNVQVWKSKFGGSNSDNQLQDLVKSKTPKQTFINKASGMSSLLSQIESDFEKLRNAFVSAQLSTLEAEYGLLVDEFKSLKCKIIASDDLGNVSIPEQKLTSKRPHVVAQDSALKKKNKESAPSKSAPSADEVDVGRLDLRIGRIVEAKRHPDADALYVETIDFGEGKNRTVISGLVKFVPLEEMQNRLIVGLCNLKPVKMRGIESQAMVMCASTPEKVEIIEVDPSAKPGDRLYVDGFEHRPDAILNPKKKVWETCAVDLKVSDTGEAVYKGTKLMPKNTKSKKNGMAAYKRMEVAETNPLYQELPRRNVKVKVDKRFQAMFTDDRFRSTRSKIDRYGKPVLKTARENLSRLYEVDEPTEATPKTSESENESDDISSSEDSDSSENTDLEEEESELHSRWGTLDHDARRVEWTSKRLAVCNMDWDQISSEDLFASLSVALPSGGKIVKVTTYLSDYGEKSLKHEDEHGPQLRQLGTKERDADDSRVQNETFVAYYMDRFRFYYAVVECSDEDTALKIYSECDGMEFAQPGLRLDLRFIDDSTTFETARIRDECTSVNMKKYRPKHTDTMLTRTRVTLDWDNNGVSRKAAISNAFNENGDLQDASALLASGSDDDELMHDTISTRLGVQQESVEVNGEQESATKVHLEKRKLKRKMLKERLVAKKKAKEARSRKQEQKAEQTKTERTNDSRFEALFTDSRFSIDPTHSAYKGGSLVQRQVSEKIKRQKVRHC